jgi:hypothetical protein
MQGVSGRSAFLVDTGWMVLAGSWRLDAKNLLNSSVRSQGLD